ncbi:MULTISPECIES: DUF4157 domain-containing protein [unclassified Ensifer]|uniref:eCIS core domain-containing protein n=1 Tax=unclassified Ensifer TaxID=2633371 RepID=UPI00088E93C2|nr:MULTISPECIES: DUF4157 domain-containing protein [unclassified Ensifer]MBD9596811.1 DUF4157 domain-containing protein [Ensifer sp. ENS05]MBD9627618.1 DUF4157 domain-containing protein [Ensifer sp. ENS06]SDN55757.1 protein of unknown function [Ensifer sp. YR511]
MSVSVAQAAKPPAFAVATPTKHKAEPLPDQDQVPRRLLSSLSSVPSVQRVCAECAREDDEHTMPVMPRLEVGPVDDPFEREADDIAGRVMATREPNSVQRAGLDAETPDAMPRRIRRKCSACGGDETPVIPRLEVGPVDHPHEAEADSIAATVMTQRPGTGLQRRSEDDEPEVMARRSVVQRKCAACSAAEEEMPVMPRRAVATVQRIPSPLLEREMLHDLTDMPRMRADGPAGTEHIAASAGQLESGGSALSPQTRDFFESRMGRDLSDVRIHRGSASDALNDSISSLAFTYRNHVWLGRNEAEAPSFTMAHELAHVLQQTQPDEVQPKVRRVPSEIISETLYFGEDPQKTPTHDLVVADAVKKNAKLMGEVAVPNAQRDKGSVDDGFGYADLVISDPNKLWGLRFAPYTGIGSSTGTGTGTGAGGPTALPWYVVSDGGKNVVPKSLGYDTRKSLHIGGAALRPGGGYEKYSTESSPRWATTDFIRSALDAPSSYEIGDVKFAGDRDRMSDAEKQVGDYATGFNEAARRYNKTVEQSEAVKNGTAPAGTLTGSSRSNSLARTNFSAAKMASSASSGDFIPLESALKLRLNKYSKTILGRDKYENVTGFTYTGKSYYRQKSGAKFLWEYVFWPDEIKEQDTSTSRSNRRDKLTEASQTLYDQMVSSPTGKKVMPLRHADARVQPKKPKKPLPPQEDPFQAQYNTWKEKQRTFTRTFADYTNIKTGTGKADIAKLAFDTAIQNTVKLLGGTGPDGSRPVQDTAALTKAQTEFNRAELMEGRSGRMLGAMRKTFGATFVKALNIYHRLKTKFENFLAGAKKRTSGGKIGKAIMKVGGVIFGAIIKVMLPQVGAYLVDCVEEGFKSLLKSMIGSDFSKYTDSIEGEFVKKYEEIAAQIEAKVEEAAEAIKTRFGSIYEAVMDTWEAAKTLISIARHVFNVARIASCAAGGLETVGISCVVAGVDYILSLFDISPSEYLLSHMLGSCVAQDLIKEFILGRAIIQNLPKEIAETIRSHLKDILPPEVKPLLCDHIGDAPDLPDAAEVPCEDIDNPGSGRGGSDLSKPPPGFPPGMNERRATQKEIREHGRLGTGIVDNAGKVDRSKLPEEFRKLLEPEAPPPPGTPEVWDPPDKSSPPTAKSSPPADKQTVPDAAKDKPAGQPPEQKPAGGAAGGSGGQPGSGGQSTQSVRRGQIADPSGTVTSYHTILPGPSGGFAQGRGDAKTLFDVYLYVQTSDLKTFGPLPIRIKVIEVGRDKSGDWIKYLPDGPYVLKNDTEIEINPTGSDGFWAKLSADR